MMELNFIVERLELQVGTEAVRWLLNLKNFLQLGLIHSYIYSITEPRILHMHVLDSAY